MEEMTVKAQSTNSRLKEALFLTWDGTRGCASLRRDMLSYVRAHVLQPGKRTSG